MRQVLDVALPTVELPAMFCWTKYGTEAGESAEIILKRKELERQVNGGTFLWGIGNAIGPSIQQLIASVPEPKVVFTPMLSRPASKDVTPASVGVWHRGVDMDGVELELPAGSRVTSRLNGSGRPHYALVCRSAAPVWESRNSRSPSPGFKSTDVVNLRSGSRVGSSQVTSVVRRIGHSPGNSRAEYSVSLVVDLVAPYVIRLTEHTVVA